MSNTNVMRQNTLWEQLKPGDKIYVKEGFFTNGYHEIKSKIHDSTTDVKGFVTTSSMWIPINQVDIKKSGLSENHEGGRRRNRKSKRKTRSRYSRRN